MKSWDSTTYYAWPGRASPFHLLDLAQPLLLSHDRTPKASRAVQLIRNQPPVMDAWHQRSPRSKTDEKVSSISSQSDDNSQSRATSRLNPYADLELPDGRRFRITELRAYEAHEREFRGGPLRDNSQERHTQNEATRWQVEMEVQGDGRGDNFLFWVSITWAAVRRGELERMGYGRRCDRPTAIFLLARERVWQHLRVNCYPPRYSSHQWGIHLQVE